MNVAGGCLFLAVVSGIGTFLSCIAVSVAVDGNEKYTGWVVAVAIFFTLTFMASGFLAAATRI